METFKLAFKVKVDDWRVDVDWLFKERRDPAIHHGSPSRPSVPHPFYVTNAAQEMANYSAEASTKAVSLMLDILAGCLTLSGPRGGQVQSLIDLRVQLAANV